MDRDVRGDVHVDGLELFEGYVPNVRVQEEPVEVEQVGALLRLGPILQRLELHRDERARFGHLRGCRGDHLATPDPEHLHRDDRRRVRRPRVGGGVQAVPRVVARIGQLGGTDFEDVHAHRAEGRPQHDGGGVHLLWFHS